MSEETVDTTARRSPGADRRSERHDWVVSVSHILSGLAFVAGCIAFYVPEWYDTGVTLFLIGSIFMVIAAALEALRRHARPR